jgi:hypothetical protein
MERNMEDIISQQISAAIDALCQAKAKLASEEIDSHLGIAASFIHDIQFNVMLLGKTENNGGASRVPQLQSMIRLANNRPSA